MTIKILQSPWIGVDVWLAKINTDAEGNIISEWTIEDLDALEFETKEIAIALMMSTGIDGEAVECDS